MDKYDKAIQFFTKNPDEIQGYWGCPDTSNGCLFKFMSAKSEYKKNDPADEAYIVNGENYYCGCLTQIKGGPDLYAAFDKKLTDQIINDPEIPDRPSAITVESLPVFAKYQRKADKLREKLKLKKKAKK